MKRFVLDQDNDPVPVLRMYDRFGRMTDHAATADSIEVRLFDGRQAEFQICAENSVYVLQ